MTSIELAAGEGSLTLDVQRPVTVVRVARDRRDALASDLAAVLGERAVVRYVDMASRRRDERRERAVAVADRLAAVEARLAAIPAPPPPPEWLVKPALAELERARAAVADAEASTTRTFDPVLIERAEQAHADVLAAEQVVMRKDKRASRRRLEAAHAAERDALAALGVASYGEYLQRVAPAADGGRAAEERLAGARAALADAEAVWEELHGGHASRDYTDAKTDQARARTDALVLLGEHDAPPEAGAAGPSPEELQARLRALADERDDDGAGASGAELGSHALLLAHLVAARLAAQGGPIVVDARAVGGLQGWRIVERAAETGKIVVLGDEATAETWAAGLGDRAAVISI